MYHARTPDIIIQILLLTPAKLAMILNVIAYVQSMLLVIELMAIDVN